MIEEISVVERFYKLFVKKTLVEGGIPEIDVLVLLEDLEETLMSSSEEAQEFMLETFEEQGLEGMAEIMRGYFNG